MLAATLAELERDRERWAIHVARSLLALAEPATASSRAPKSERRQRALAPAERRPPSQLVRGSRGNWLKRRAIL